MMIEDHFVYVRPGFVPQKSWAVFLDRDGVINKEKGFVFKLEDFELIPEIIQALHKLNQASIPVMVVHNAAAVSRNLCQPDQVEAFNQRIIDELLSRGVFIDAVFYCPHHVEAFSRDFVKDCHWRKPQAGMLQAAAKQFTLDLSRSYLIGDHERDILAAEAVGVRGFFIKNGEDILAAVDQIV